MEDILIRLEANRLFSFYYHREGEIGEKEMNYRFRLMREEGKTGETGL